MEEPTPISPFTALIEMFMTFLSRLDSAKNLNQGRVNEVTEVTETIETMRAELFLPAQLPHYLPEINRHHAELFAIMNEMWLIRKARVASDAILRYTSRETETMISEEVGDETYVITYPILMKKMCERQNPLRCMNILIIMKEGSWYVCGKSRDQDYYESQRSYDCLFDLLHDIMIEIKTTSAIRISNSDIFTRSFDGYRDIETLNNVISLRESLPDSNANTHLYDSFTKYLYLVRHNIDDVTGPIARMKHDLEKLLSENLRLETLPQYFGFVPGLHLDNILKENPHRPFQWFISKTSTPGIYLLHMIHNSQIRTIQIMYRDGMYKYLKDHVMSQHVRWEPRKSFFHCLMSALMSGSESETESWSNFDFTKCDVFSNEFKKYWEYRYAENQEVMTSLLRNCDSISSFLDTVDLTDLERPPVQDTLLNLMQYDDLVEGSGN